MQNPNFRRAERADLPAIIALLRDDVLGAAREIGSDDDYAIAFRAIANDPNQFLCVADDQGAIIGTMQISIIPGLTRAGTMRGQIEAVRVAANRRSEGIGEAMFRWAVAFCREKGCALIQLTTDRSRPDAHRFYEHLGFSPTHIGYKLELTV